MTPAFQVLLDTPNEPAKRIQIAKLGSFHDARYGDFDISPDNVANWQANLAKLPGGEALIDFEHRSERKPRDSKAAGWITAIDLDGDRVMAAMNWTPLGEQAVRDRVYRFISPVFGKALGADNQLLDDALPSVALTNKPVLGMPALSLASDERVAQWLADDPAARFYTRALEGDHGEQIRALIMLDVSQAERDRAHAAGHSLPDGSYPIDTPAQLHAAATLAASHHGNWQAAQRLIRRRAKELSVDLQTLPGFAGAGADSRALSMNPELLTLLGLDDSADDAKLLEAVTALKAQADKPAPAVEPVRTLEQQAADSGQVLLDAGAVATLQRQAAAGEAAQQQLHAQRFDTAFQLALEDSRGPRVKPAERDTLQHFYALDADATITMIEAREPLVDRSRPTGAPAMQLDRDADPQELAANGIHPTNHSLHERIRQYMLDNKIATSEYAKVIEQFIAGQVIL